MNAAKSSTLSGVAGRSIVETGRGYGPSWDSTAFNQIQGVARWGTAVLGTGEAFQASIEELHWKEGTDRNVASSVCSQTCAPAVGERGVGGDTS